MIKKVMAVEFEAVGKYNTPDVVVRLTDYDHNEVTVEALDYMIEALRKWKQNLAKAQCNCTWVFQPGCISTIDCGHENVEIPERFSVVVTEADLEAGRVQARQSRHTLIGFPPGKGCQNPHFVDGVCLNCTMPMDSHPHMVRRV